MIEIEMYEDLPRDVIQELWDQNICMDDWDYLLFIPYEYIENFSIEKEDDFKGNLKPNSSYIENLLQGCCCNAWYEVSDFMGKRGVLGIAYHA